MVKLDKILDMTSDKIFYVVKDMDLDAIVITQTWLTGNVSDQTFVGDLTSAGYSVHPVARFHKKGRVVDILLRDSLECDVFSKLPTDFCIWGLGDCVGIIY